MKKKIYEKPEFDFQEMALFERVADTCWGTSSVWLDVNGDSQATEGLDIHLDTSGGCQGSWSSNAMTNQIAELNSVLNAFNSSGEYSTLAAYSEALASWAVNSKCTYIAPISVTPTSSWANTKQSSGGGIIIIGS